MTIDNLVSVPTKSFPSGTKNFDQCQLSIPFGTPIQGLWNICIYQNFRVFSKIKRVAINSLNTSLIRHCIESNFDLYFHWMFSWECLCPEFMMKASFPGVTLSPILDLAEILLKLGLSFHIWRSSSSYVKFVCEMNEKRTSGYFFFHTQELITGCLLFGLCGICLPVWKTIQEHIVTLK